MPKSKTSPGTSSKLSSSSSRIEEQNHTLVSLYDIDDVSPRHCGYCNENGNVSIGMQSESMKIEDYQLLIDRGWRRSGTYIYKPVMNKTCCPLYTIRCETINFELRKSQKNVLKIMKKFLEKNERKSACVKKDQAESTSNKKVENKKNTSQVHASQTRNSLTNARRVMNYFLDEKDLKEENTNLTPNQILNIPKLKAKHKRLFRKLKVLKEKNLISEYSDIQKHLKRNLTETSNSNQLENFLKLDPSIKTPANKLEVRLVRSWPPSKEFQETLKQEHEVYTKYQSVIHNDSPLECSMSQFQRFLCVSPLMQQSYTGPLSSKNLGYGSFHQQYILNDKIIAVGVIDILNDCVSSVYFFYDPEYQFLNLGTYSVLREIEFTRELNKQDGNIKWYYLGFYAHTCKKMRYKGLFQPSFLLCPETYTWHSIEFCFHLLDKQKYNRFEIDQSLNDVNSHKSLENVQIRVKFRDSEMKIFQFNEFCHFLKEDFVPQFRHLVDGYCKLFGEKFSNRVLIKF